MHAQVHDVSLLLTRASVLDCLIACVLALALARLYVLRCVLYSVGWARNVNAHGTGCLTT